MYQTETADISLKVCALVFSLSAHEGTSDKSAR